MTAQLEALANIPDVLHAEREAQADAGYKWDNLGRNPRGTVVVQRTVAGAAFHADRSGTRAAGAGQAMLFSYGEDSRYWIGDPADRPYVLEYVVLKPVGGIADLAAQIRHEFGGVVRMAERGEAARLVEDIVTAFATGRQRDRLEMAESSYRLLLAIYREQVTAIEGSDPVAFVRHLLQSQFRSPKNLKEWLHGRGISREHFTRAFHGRYGETPAAYLRRLRLEHARLLARTSRMPVEDIAAASGFGHSQTLRRAFRREFGQAVGSERPSAARG